jgi:hypothetical protein
VFDEVLTRDEVFLDARIKSGHDDGEGELRGSLRADLKAMSPERRAVSVGNSL